MKDEGKQLFFYLLSFAAMVFFLIWSIANFADANGFTMVSENFKNGRGAAGVFGLITALLMLGIAVLNPINMFLFWKR